jgi:hypothetical protein
VLVGPDRFASYEKLFFLYYCTFSVTVPVLMGRLAAVKCSKFVQYIRDWAPIVLYYCTVSGISFHDAGTGTPVQC